MSHTQVSLSFYLLCRKRNPCFALFSFLLIVIRFYVLGCYVGIWAASERRWFAWRKQVAPISEPVQLQCSPNQTPNPMAKKKQINKNDDIKIEDLEAALINQALSLSRFFFH